MEKHLVFLNYSTFKSRSKYIRLWTNSQQVGYEPSNQVWSPARGIPRNKRRPGGRRPVCVRKDTTSFASLLATSFSRRLTSFRLADTKRCYTFRCKRGCFRQTVLCFAQTMWLCQLLLHCVQIYGIIYTAREVIATKPFSAKTLKSFISLPLLNIEIKFT